MKFKVKVLATDFNGHSWDGSPFSWMPHWLFNAIRHDEVVPVRCDRDYTLWDVQTANGVVRAEPGNYIELAEDGRLRVV